MAGKKTETARSLHRSSKKNASAHGFYTPFAGLDQHLVGVSSRTSSAIHRPPPAVPPVRGDEEAKLFQEAMSDVVPISRKHGDRVRPCSPNRKAPHFLAREELEVYGCLVDLVTGDGPFELAYSDEYVDGAVVGLSPEVLRKLRHGEFSYQNHLDLHGCIAKEAHERVKRFVFRSFALKHRCILIIPGRGLNSKDREPVLKQSLVTWLTRAPLKRFVLAFASARSWDGGAGAFYVLLRRNKGKRPLVTPAV